MVISLGLTLVLAGQFMPNRPLMRDFIGLNTHTVQFRPELYAPVSKMVRDYHPVDWDLGDSPSNASTLPKAKNGVEWKDLYGAWRKAGNRIDASLMFESFDPEKWMSTPDSAYSYGKSFAAAFGPTKGGGLVECAEIGNEPTKYTPVQYRTIFESMAGGLRAGDPRMLIATCAVADSSKDPYSKSLGCIRGLEDLYDVLSVHSYPFAEQWPTWRRSFPEDPAIHYLKDVQDVVDWRNLHARGKSVWVTEFGYDSSTKQPDPKGEWAKWIGVTDLEQARYIVRSYLMFSSMDVQRAYLYWFNDEDQPMLHAASGLTRNFKPKPSYHAVTHLLRSLGDYRFSRIVTRDPNQYVFEYRRGVGSDIVWVAWSPTGSDKKSDLVLPFTRAQIVRAERMPVTADRPHSESCTLAKGGVRFALDESPLFIWLNRD